MRIALTTFLLLLVPLSAVAESGFADGGIWLGSDPVFSGEEVRVYAAVSNTDANELSGVVIFYDQDSEIGRDAVSIPPRKSALAQITWEATEGDHAFSAGFESDDGDIRLARASTSPLTAFIDTDTDGDGIGNRDDADDDNDGIPDDEDERPLVHKDKELAHDVKETAKKAVDAVRPVVEEQGPKVVEATKDIVSALDAFREGQAAALVAKREALKREITRQEEAAATAQSGEGGGNESAETSGPSALDRAQLTAVSAAAFVFDNAALFYLVAVVLLYFLGSRLVRYIRRRTGADRLEA